MEMYSCFQVLTDSVFYKKVAMVNNSAYTNEINKLNANIIAIINKSKNQKKRADIDSLHKQFVKSNSMQDFTKTDPLKKVHDLITEGKIVN